MRTFLAAEFQPSLEAAARPAQDALKGRVGGGFRWPHPGQVHLTLRFLGEIPDGIVPELGVAITQAVAELPTFPLKTSAYGAFPDAHGARILWLGLEDPAGALPGLLGALDSALKPFNLRWEERPFVAHLTLGRHRAGGADVTHAFRAAGNPSPSEHRLTGVSLYRSILGSQGAAHTCLALAPLASGG